MSDRFEALPCDCETHPKGECVPMARYYPDLEMLEVQSRRYGAKHRVRVAMPLDIWEKREYPEGGRE